MYHQIILKSKVEKELRRIPREERYKIERAIENISIEPLSGKKLEGEYKGHYSYRAWPYRIIYIFYPVEKFITIIRIAHRQGVYK